MKKQAFDLNNLGLAAMSDLEMSTTDGGGVPRWLRTFGLFWFVDEFTRNWDDIKQGAKEGWNSVHYN